jgi:hypothetical protein
MTALDETGMADTAYARTEHHGFALPPKTGRFIPKMDGYGRYRLPHPTKEVLTSFTRVTTIAKTLDDTYNLEQWAKRNVLTGMTKSPALVAAATAAVNDGATVKDLNAIVAEAEVAAGARRASEFGTAVHAWLEYVDHGLCLPSQVPEEFRPWVDAYLQHALGRNCLIAPPEYTERIVVNLAAGAVGTLDRIFQLPDGTYCLGDVKTSKADSLRYGYLTFAIQLAAYASADLMLSLDGKSWEPMPPLRQDFAVLAHVPSDDPSLASAVTFDLEAGRVGLAESVKVREMRARAGKVIPNRHALPIPSAQYSRQQAAVLALRTSASPDAVSAVWTEYQDVWNDALTQLGHAVVAQLTSTSK